MYKNPVQAYHQVAVRGASPLELIVMLYDAALRSLNEAVRAVENNDIERRIAVLNHALSVIGELQGALDFQRGGDVAQRLSHFYNVARGKILEASIKVSRDILQQLIAQFTSLREAWQQAAGAQVVSLQQPPTTLPSPPAATAAGAGSCWSA